MQQARAEQLKRLGEESDEEYLARTAERLSEVAKHGEAEQSDSVMVNVLRRACREDTAASWAARAPLVAESLLEEGTSAGETSGAGAGTKAQREETADGLGRYDSVRPGHPLLVKPVQGMMVLWRNHDDMGRLDMRTRHGACELEPSEDNPEIARTTKLVSQRWFNWRSQRVLRPDGGIVEEQEENILADTLVDCIDDATAKRLGIAVAEQPPGWPLPVAELVWSTNQINAWE